MYWTIVQKDGSLVKEQPVLSKLNDGPINKSLIQRYVRYINSRIHRSQFDPEQPRTYSSTPARTGLGRSRLPRTTVSGTRQMVCGLPHSKNGRRARAYRINRPLEMNKKQKKKAIAQCLRWLLQQRLIYIIEQAPSKTKELLNIAPQVSSFLNSATRKIIGSMREEDALCKAARNLNNTKILSQQKAHYFLLVEGFRPHFFITTKQYAQFLLDTYLTI